MLLLVGFRTTTKTKNSTLCSAAAAAARCLMLLMLSSLSELTDAWGCSRCQRFINNAQEQAPARQDSCLIPCPTGLCTALPIRISDCVDCLAHECLDYCDGDVSYTLHVDLSAIDIFDVSLPYHDFCEWKQENGKELDTDGFEVDHFLDCTEWDQCDNDNGTNNLEIVNSAPEEGGINHVKCYHCDQRCTRLYTCGDTTYACSHLFDVAIIQFNSESDSSCRDIVPLESDHEFEYCSSPYEREFTIDCGTPQGDLCDLEVEDIVSCPNGNPLDSYWTVCSDDQGEFARRIFTSDLSDDLKAAIGDNTGLLDSPPLLFDGFYDFGHWSCVDFGEVTCEGVTITPAPSENPTESQHPSTSPSISPKNAKKKAKGKKAKQEKKAKGKKAKDESCRRKLRPKKKEGDCEEDED